MSPNDGDTNVDGIDDPTPPEPDAARLQVAVARGRQRLVRRRAIYGALVASIVVALIGSGVAVAQHNDTSPQVQVRPPTTVGSTAADAREADANGLHYTLTLETPVVVAGAEVHVALHVVNRASRAAVGSMCTFHIVVVPASEHALFALTGGCQGGLHYIQPGASSDSSAGAEAPAAPGRYAVVVEPDSSNVLPASLVKDSFDLRVVPAGAPTTVEALPVGPGPTEGAPTPTVPTPARTPTTRGGP
jgi:hypothetical protein